MRVDATVARKITSAERRIEIIEMRKQGWTVREIGRAMGISHNAVHKHEVKALADLAQRADDVTSGYRALQMARLEDEYREINSIINDKEASVTNKLNAVNLRLQISDRISRLMGTDAPLRIESKSLLVSTMSAEQVQRLATRSAQMLDCSVIDADE